VPDIKVFTFFWDLNADLIADYIHS